jgi:hypothetical protein
MDQDDAPILFVALHIDLSQPPNRQLPAFCGSHHRSRFDKETFPTQITFQIGRPRLRLRQKIHAGADTYQLGGQLQFSQRGLSDTVIVVGKARDEAT